MAANMDALMRIAARVTGIEQVTKLGSTFKSVEGAARGLTSSTGLLGGALGALAPVVTVGGLVALVGKTIDAGKQMYEFSQQTGVSVEMLGKFKKAAGMTGVDMETVAGAFVKLGRSMYLAASQSGFAGRTKEEIEKAVESVKNGERRQTDLVKDQADRRVSALERETDRRLKEIDKRYRREERLLSDSFDDQRDAQDRAAQEETEQQTKTIQRRYDARKKAINADTALNDEYKTKLLQSLEDQEDEELDAVRDGAAKKSKERQRASRDRLQKETDALNERKDKEESVLKQSLETEKNAIKKSVDFRIDQIKRVADESEKALKKDAGADEAAQQMEDLGLSGKKASKAFAELGISIKNSDGSLRDKGEVMLEMATKLGSMTDKTVASGLAMDILGKSGYKMLPIFALGGAAIEGFTSKMTTLTAGELKQYSIQLTVLSGKIAGLGIDLTKALLPALTTIASGVGQVVEFFMKMPAPIQGAALVVAAFAVGLTAAAAALAPFAILLGSLAGTGVLTAVTAGLGGILALVLSWPAALVAAGVAIFLFRDQIYGVVDGINKSIQDTFKNMIKAVISAVDTINKTIQTGIRAVWDWVSSAVGNVARSLAAPFEAAAGAIKNVLRSVLQFGANVINGFLGAVNQMINAVNSVAARLRLPQLPTFGTVSVPSFKGGGYTGDAPRSGGLDGQGGFMAMLHPRETVIDHAKTSSGGGVPNITIETGQVLQMPDGSQWVSMADLEQAMQATAAGVLGQLRTPAGRVALGGA
jgi:hypothetical protein